MTYAALSCCKKNSGYDTKLSRDKKAAIVFDSLLSLTLLVIGVLAIMGNGTAVGFPLHGIGSIGVLEGGAMVGLGFILFLVDISVLCCKKTKSTTIHLKTVPEATDEEMKRAKPAPMPFFKTAKN